MMKRFAAAALAAFLLSGCIPLMTALPIAVGVYCAGVSESGKRAVREQATGGLQVIACEEARHAP